MLRTLAEGLAARGHRVTVFTTQPSYRTSMAARQPADERLGGVRVLRIPVLPERGRSFAVRVLNNAWYVMALFVHLVAGGHYDVVVAATFPPVLAGRAASLAARLTRTPFIYHCQDLHPEVGRVSGMLNGVLFRLLRGLDRRTCRVASRVVVLSEDMRATLEQRPRQGALRVTIINNFLPESFSGEGSGDGPVPTLRGEGFHIVFAGNLGRFQGLETVVDAAHLLATESRIHFTFVGGGVAEAELRNRAGSLLERTVHFLPQQPRSVAEALVGAADAALVTLRRGVYRVAYPSKTLTCLAMGSPILAAVEAESELARTIESEGVGWVASAEDPEDLARVVRTAFREREDLPAVRDRARALYERRFAVGRALEAWARLVNDVTAEPAASERP